MDTFTIWDRDVEEVNGEGIHYLGGFIDFAECAARFQKLRGGDGTFVGECRDGGKVKYLLFYSERIYTRLAFDSEAPIKSLFTKRPSDRERLLEVKEKIEAAGYRLSEIK